MSGDLSKCPFCKVGQYNRNLMYRLVKNMSRSQLKEAIAEKNGNKKGKFKI